MKASDDTSLSKRVVYEAEDNRLQRTLGEHLRAAWRQRAFLVSLAVRNLVVRYRETSAGWLWAILQPLLLSLVYLLVFSFILRVPTEVPYAVFILANVVLWNYFFRSITVGMLSVFGNIDLITRMPFPREYVPIAAWAETFVDFLIGMVIVLIVMAGYQVPFSWSMLAVPLVFLVMSWLTVGIMLLLTALNVKIRDLQQAVPILLQLLFYLTPILYPLDIVPERFRMIYLLNPLSVIYSVYNAAFFDGEIVFPALFAAEAVLSFCILLGGYIVYKHFEWKFVDML
jgi:lipopolysaccharide transport system permease protein